VVPLARQAAPIQHRPRARFQSVLEGFGHPRTCGGSTRLHVPYFVIVPRNNIVSRIAGILDGTTCPNSVYWWYRVDTQIAGVSGINVVVMVRVHGNEVVRSAAT
jgi:hypothetical protein